MQSTIFITLRVITATMKHFRIIFLIYCISYIQFAPGQDFTPIVKQFGKNDYQASNQNWSVTQDRNGIMYFGNNLGLLEFDGSMWEIYRMPQNKLVRSVLAADDGRIYAGSFEEFGFFERQANGKLVYSSLSMQLKDYTMTNDEIWTITILGKKVIFQSFTSYFIYENGSVKGYRQPVTFLFFSNHKNNIFVHTTQYGYCRLDLNQHKLIPVNQQPVKGAILSLLSFSDGRTIAVTRNDGLYEYDGSTFRRFVTSDEALFASIEINKALITPDDQLILGTIRHGVVTFDAKGRKRWTLNRSNVLQNNTVLGITSDDAGNVWLALDKGIAFVQTNSVLQFINSFAPPVGAVYDVGYESSTVYLGTNQGLFAGTFKSGSVENLIPFNEIKGQVWDISSFDGQLLIGNNDATFSIKDGNLKRLSPVQGGMCMARGVIHGQEVLVQGTYTQLCVYQRRGREWVFMHTVDGFVNPIRYLEIDYTGRIWASHLHQGLYAIQLNPDLRTIDDLKAYSSLDGKNKYNINVFSINNRVVFTDHHRFYTYDDISGKIIVYNELNASLGLASRAYRIVKFKADTYWLIRDTEASLYSIKPGATRLLDVVHYSDFKSQTVDDYQNIIPFADDWCFITLENGLALYRLNSTRLTTGRPIRLQLKQLTISDARMQNQESLDLTQEKPDIPNVKNNLTFQVYYPDYSQMNNLRFSYLLEGRDKVWTEPVASTKKAYSFLPYGKYQLQINVSTSSGQHLSSFSYVFEVEPPFYWSVLARFVYILLILLLIYGIFLAIRKRYHKKHLTLQKTQEEKQKKEIEKREQEIVALKNEKLEAELTLKSKELAESTMSLINKNEMLARIKEEVSRQKEALGSQYPNKYYDKLVRMIDENIGSEDDWLRFQANFDRIHENFFRNLHRDFPDLTANDLRFCAYLRLNLSSKDIAHLMNISLKGVEVARYRIRKKINLPSHKSLTEFMIEFK